MSMGKADATSKEFVGVDEFNAMLNLIIEINERLKNTESLLRAWHSDGVPATRFVSLE